LIREIFEKKRQDYEIIAGGKKKPTRGFLKEEKEKEAGRSREDEGGGIRGGQYLQGKGSPK